MPLVFSEKMTKGALATSVLRVVADMDMAVDDIAIEVKTPNSWSPVVPEPRERIEELVRKPTRLCPCSPGS
jgi:hypothetical protein